jgi:hypothetical protein
MKRIARFVLAALTVLLLAGIAPQAYMQVHEPTRVADPNLPEGS